MTDRSSKQRRKRRPRAQRPLPEMFAELRRHTRLLREWIEKTEQGDRDYLGSIAAVLRTLVVERGRNQALLLRLYDATGHMSWVTIAGPPEVPLLREDSGRRYTLGEWMNAPRYWHYVGGEEINETPADFVLAWAQQQGLAHQDWALDDYVLASREGGEQASALMRAIGINVPPVHDLVLLNIARVVLSRAEAYLATVKPDDLARAEARRNR